MKKEKGLGLGRKEREREGLRGEEREIRGKESRRRFVRCGIVFLTTSTIFVPCFEGKGFSRGEEKKEGYFFLF